MPEKTSTKSDRLTIAHILRSPLVQGACVVISLLVVAAVHSDSDGLWLQGDSPRHAMNGLFWWDLITTAPSHPLAFMLRYYARYPAISPATYPPLFYLIEGLSFAIFGTSGHVALGLVSMFTAAACFYTMAWARRWIDPMAGWSGVFLSFTPGVVIWSNSVMLNIPALALGVATLYHCRRWIESSTLRQLLLTMTFAVLTLATYYLGAIVLGISIIWILYRRREIVAKRQLVWLGAAAGCALLPVLAALVLAPVQAVRYFPPVSFLREPESWIYYWRQLPLDTGNALIGFGGAGLLIAACIPAWRKEAAYLALWILIVMTVMSALPARDPRYVLLVVPALVVAAALGLHIVAQTLPSSSSRWQGVLLSLAAATGLFSATQWHISRTSGFNDVAVFLRKNAPHDAVLFDGEHSGVFVFHVRAVDPDFHQRVALGPKLLYQSAPRATFDDVRENKVASVADVVTMVRTKCGCRWVAVESFRRPADPLGRQLLYEALKTSAFHLVRSFPIIAGPPRKIDLYRIDGPVDNVTSIDMQFPSYSNEQFSRVAPITR